MYGYPSHRRSYLINTAAPQLDSKGQTVIASILRVLETEYPQSTVVLDINPPCVPWISNLETRSAAVYLDQQAVRREGLTSALTTESVNKRNLKAVTDVVTRLQACAEQKDLLQGARVHAHILKTELLKHNCYLPSALLNMYAKCGALTKAVQVLHDLSVRDITAWNAVIAGYSQEGQGEDALTFFEWMQCEGLSPNAVTFISALKAVSRTGTAIKGEQIHNEIIKQGFLQKSVRLGNSLLDMYVKCGSLAKAAQVLEELPIRDIVSWNTLLIGHAQQQNGGKALTCFEQMECEGIFPDTVTFIGMLRVCANRGAANKGEQIYNSIIRQGLMDKETLLVNSLMDMYVKCGALRNAAWVADRLPGRDAVTWNTLIAGYLQQGDSEEAFNCFHQMQREGLSPDIVTYTCILKVCSDLRLIDKGKEIHKEIVKRGIVGNDIVLATALVDMYASYGALANAVQVLDELLVRGEAIWNALILGCVQQGWVEHALNCFILMQYDGVSLSPVTLKSVLKACGSIGAVDKGKHLHDMVAREGFLEHSVVGNSLVIMYVQCNSAFKAAQVIDQLPIRDVVSWSALIRGHVQEGEVEQAFNCFKLMQQEGLSPNPVTFIHILKACGNMRVLDKGEQFHDQIIRRGLLDKDGLLGIALVDMYAKCGALGKAIQVFDELPMRDVVAWSVVITAYAQQGQGEAALSCFEQMKYEGLAPNAVTFIALLKVCDGSISLVKGQQIHHEIERQGLLRQNEMLDSALVDMYAKCGALAKAVQMLNELSARDVVSWCTLIRGYSDQGQGDEAVKCFDKMKCEGLVPDTVTFTSILNACANMGSVNKGKEIHYEIVRQGLLGKDVILDVALINMYAKCGALAKAAHVLETLPAIYVIAWNALIAGFAQEGKSMEAIYSFEQMQHEGLSPDTYTFLYILKACSGSHLLNKAEFYVVLMGNKYGISTNAEHHTCMIDLFMHAGEFGKALAWIKETPAFYHLPAWLAFLSACRESGNVNMGKLAFNNAVQINKNDASAYVVMSKIYAATDMQEEAYVIEAMRRKWTIKKCQDR